MGKTDVLTIRVDLRTRADAPMWSGDSVTPSAPTPKIVMILSKSDAMSVAACRRGLQRGWSLSSFSTGVSPRRASPRCAHIQTTPSLSHPEALSFVSAAENGRRLEMDLKLRGAGYSTRSSGSG